MNKKTETLIKKAIIILGGYFITFSNIEIGATILNDILSLSIGILTKSAIITGIFAQAIVTMLLTINYSIKIGRKE